MRSSTISRPQNLSQSLELWVLPSRLDSRQKANPPRVSTPFAPALSLCETTQEPYIVCEYTRSVQLVGIVSQAEGGWILKSYSQGRTISLNMKKKKISTSARGWWKFFGQEFMEFFRKEY